MPDSRFALHGLAPPKFTVCAPFFASNSRLTRLFQAALDPSSRFAIHGLRALEFRFGIKKFSAHVRSAEVLPYENITLPLLQKNLVDFCFKVTWGFGLGSG